MKSCASLASEKSVDRNDNDSQSPNISIIILICNTTDHPCCDEPTRFGHSKKHSNYAFMVIPSGLWISKAEQFRGSFHSGRHLFGPVLARGSDMKHCV